MKIKTIFTIASVFALLHSISAFAYSGKGGMTANSIKPEVYMYHYNHGFTGIDAMGWDSNLQYAWSRLGAAKTCKISFDEATVFSNLESTFGQMKLIHELNGVMFHHMQSQAIKSFCDDIDRESLRKTVEDFEKNNFPKPF